MKLMDLNFSYWFLQTIAMMVTAFLIPNLKVTSPIGAFLTVVGIALVNAKLWDAALFFQIPDTLTTQAATLFLANGLIFFILVKILPGIEVEGFFPALIAPVVFTLSSLAISKYGPEVPWQTIWNRTSEIISSTKNNLEEQLPQKDHTPAVHTPRH